MKTVLRTFLFTASFLFLVGLSLTVFFGVAVSFYEGSESEAFKAIIVFGLPSLVLWYFWFKHVSDIDRKNLNIIILIVTSLVALQLTASYFSYRVKQSEPGTVLYPSNFYNE